MKILYDYQTFFNQDFGGISRYFYELFSSYNDDSEFTFELPIKYSNNIYLKELESFKNKITIKNEADYLFKQFLNGFEFRGKRKLYNFKKRFNQNQPCSDLEINKSLSIKKIKEGNYDIFHPTYYDNYFLEFIENKPYVITVYDMIHQIFPEYFLWENMDKSKPLLKNASKIIAISECTKKDLINIFEIDEKNIEVTYLANSLKIDYLDLNNIFINGLPHEFLLFVGTRSAYKNFYFFIQAFAVLSKHFNNLTVVCTGKPFDDVELNYFEKLGIKDKVYQYFINDTKLSILYQKAKAFVFPSMYEGFGIPVLEAFACGCPVIISNAGSLPEIGQNAALYFESKDMESLIAVLKKVLLSFDTQQEMIQNGYEQLKNFSWDKTAVQTKNIYHNIILNN